MFSDIIVFNSRFNMNSSFSNGFCVNEESERENAVKLFRIKVHKWQMYFEYFT